jgi:5-methylcytosine-specific restriction protein A
VPTAPKTFRLHSQPTQGNSVRNDNKRPGDEWLHSRPWRKARKWFLARNQLCIDCEAKGDLVIATDVDHNTPHNGNYALFWDETNWRARCHSCHSRKTAREDGGFGNKG